MEADLATLLAAAEGALARHGAELDALNVFPVPDGDTGANMAATAAVAARAAAAAGAGADALSAAASAALVGARGNSGMLLSQVLRGLHEAVQDRGPTTGGCDAATLGDGLSRGAALGRAALSEPVEGSLLTAAAAAGRAARDVAAFADAPGLGPALAAAARAAHDAAERSTSQLDALARAGVVDAGARGLAVALGAAAAALGRPVPAPDVAVPARVAAGREEALDAGGRHEVMFRLDGVAGGTADRLRAGLDGLGASVSVVEDRGVVRAHVHTDDVAAALAAGRAHGVPQHVTVEDLTACDHGAAAPRFVVGTDAPGLARQLRAAGGAVVAVGPDADADEVGEGLAEAVRAVLAARPGASAGERGPVVVLPGHPAVAAAVAGLADAVAVVDRADTAPAALAAAATVLADPDPDVLAGAAAAVRTGRVVAGRDGAWVGAAGGDEVAEGSDPLEVLRELARALAGPGPPELAQVHLGAALAGEVAGGARAVVDVLAAAWPAAELEVLDAGQADALLVLGVE